MANCMLDLESRTLSAASLTARAQAISEAPPPYTTRLSLTRLRITQRASWRARFASSTIYKKKKEKSVYGDPKVMGYHNNEN